MPRLADRSRRISHRKAAFHQFDVLSGHLPQEFYVASAVRSKRDLNFVVSYGWHSTFGFGSMSPRTKNTDDTYFTTLVPVQKTTRL